MTDPGLDELVDLGAMGPKPSSDYLEALNALDNVVRDCMHVSRRYHGIASPTGAHYYASVLFVVTITRAVSLLNLAPHSPWAAKRIEHWDYASMTGIVRTMIELRSAFHYLCIDPCSPDEWNCRWDLFNLHDSVSRIRLFDAHGDRDEVAALSTQAEELRDRIRANTFFQTLDPKRHKKLLHGQAAYLYPMEVLAERAGMEIETFRWLYVLFSTHVHALPMSFYRISGETGERGRGLPSPAEQGYSSLCLSLAATLAVHTRDEFEKLFKDLAPAEDAPEPAADIDPADANFLPVGGEDEVDIDSGLRFIRKRVSEDLLSVSYFHVPSGALVFEGEMSDTGLMFNSFDPYFWRVFINEAPATHPQVEAMLDGEFLMRLDLPTRRILFKTRD